MACHAHRFISPGRGLRLLAAALQDRLGSLFGRPPRYLPGAGRPGELAIGATEDALFGEKLMTPKDSTEWRNRVASKAGDADTADLFTEVSSGVDKLLWMVEAHVQSKD